MQYRENNGDWTDGKVNQAASEACTQNVTPKCAYQLTNAKGASSYRFQVRTVTESGGDTIYGGWKYLQHGVPGAGARARWAA